MPHKLVLQMSARTASRIAEMDKELLDGLHRVGFRTNMGLEGAGTFRLAMKRMGGWYVDVGASQMIIDGKIKLKSDSPIDHFTPAGLAFTDGVELSADVVICATGYNNLRDDIVKTFGEDFTSKLKEIWDWDKECELNSVYRDSGHEGFYVATNNLPGSRFWSRFLALQIKAMEAGIFGTRYSRN